MAAVLEGAWAFESSPVPDESGNGRTITLSGSTILTSVGNGAFGTRGLTQAGAETFTSFAMPAAFQSAQRSWMANVAFSGSTIGWIGEFYREAPSDTGVWGLLDLRGAGGTLQFRAKDSSNTERHINLPAPSGAMTNICATYDGTNLRLYIDGVLTGTLAIPAIWSATHFRLLDNSNTVVRIDDMRIFSGALTQEEIDAWRVLPATEVPTFGTPGRLKYESAPGVWTSVPIKTDAGAPVVMKRETSPGVWEALP